MKRLLIFGILLTILTSCQVFGGGDGSDSGGNADPDHPIQWERDASEIVFRAHVEGGEDQDVFYMHNVIPDCTIYGDNRIIWTTDAAEGGSQVLWDRLSDDVVRDFVHNLTVDHRFYTYESLGELEPARSTEPVVEVLTLVINGVEHRTDAFAQWPDGFYGDILELCQRLSQSPTVYMPEAAWVSAQAVPYNSSSPIIIWDGERAGLVMAELSTLEENGGRRWITDRNVGVLWNSIRTSMPDVQFAEEDGNYYVALEIPNVTLNAPAAP